MHSSMRASTVMISLVLPLAASAACWGEAGRGYEADSSLLEAIIWEGSHGWMDVISPELKDDNRVPGLMQINTTHLPNLTRFGIRREHLFDTCTSQKVGTWVLAGYIQRFGATQKSMGCYYTDLTSANVSAQVKYVRDMQWLYEGYRRQQAHQISTSSAQVASFQED